MSIWGKLGVGKPLAMLTGLIGRLFAEADGDAPGVAFTIAVIALSAKMAKADGTVTQDEVDVFHRLFRVPPQEEANVRRVFNLARQDVAGYESYARQIAAIFRTRPALLEDVLDGLFEIAKADGVLHPGELAFLSRVADIFGFTPDAFARIKAAHFGPDAADPFAVLGVSREASNEEIKRTYRLLVRENHPDSLIARGVPAEFIAMANDKLAAINGAYEKIVKLRGGL